MVMADCEEAAQVGRLHESKSGYPADYLRRSRRAFIAYAKIIFVTGGAACFFGYRAIYLDGDIQFAGVAGAVFLFSLWIGYDLVVSRMSIVLYFEEEVPGSSIWSKVLARNCTYLDEMAADVGLAPLSSFGFADDFQNETVVWHDSEQGLETVSELLNRLHRNSKSLEETDAIISDLENMKIRLEEACKSNTRFCFIFHGNAINAMEVEQRKGHF